MRRTVFKAAFSSYHHRSDGRLVLADFCRSERDNPSFSRLTIRSGFHPAFLAAMLLIRFVGIAGLPSVNALREIFMADLCLRLLASPYLSRKNPQSCVCRKLDSAILMVKAAKDRS